MKIMGLDLSMSATGIALPSGQLTTYRPTAAGDHRLGQIEGAVGYYLEQTRPDFLVIEQVPPSLRSQRAIMALVMVHGVVRCELAKRGVPFGYVGNTRLKKYATGGGGADKQQMIAAARSYGANPTNDDEADAWFLRAFGYHAAGQALHVQLALSADLVADTSADWKMPKRN